MSDLKLEAYNHIRYLSQKINKRNKKSIYTKSHKSNQFKEQNNIIIKELKQLRKHYVKSCTTFCKK